MKKTKKFKYYYSFDYDNFCLRKMLLSEFEAKQFNWKADKITALKDAINESKKDLKFWIKTLNFLQKQLKEMENGRDQIETRED